MKEVEVIKPDSWFRVVEVEVNSRCNLKCRYCPNSILPPANVPEYMNDETFERLINELVRINFTGKISYHLYSEPLLRNDLEKLIFQVKKRLPEVFQLLYTNGTLLTDERYQSLLEAGINHFKVTKHDYKPIETRPNQTVLYPENLTLTNRGGTLFKLKKSLDIPCYAPTEILIVTVTGDILLCCDDAERSHVMGNIIDQSLEEIWFSDKMLNIRELLRKGKRSEAASICRHCDDTEYYAPGKA